MLNNCIVTNYNNVKLDWVQIDNNNIKIVPCKLPYRFICLFVSFDEMNTKMDQKEN